MLDLLLCFPSFEVAAQIGQQLGFASPPGEDDDHWQTMLADHNMAIHVIGEHYYPSGEVIYDEELGENYPELVPDGQWWIMVRALYDMPIPPEIEQFIVTPDPENLMIPNRRWA